MRSENAFTFLDIERQLKKLNISFRTQGIISDARYAFKSIRNIESAGIYFLVGDKQNQPGIEGSIVLCSDLNHISNSNLYIQVDDPQLVFYQLMDAMVGKKNKPRGVHPTAVLGDGCIIDPSAYIGPFCVLENCIIKAGAMLHSHVTVMSGATIEENVTIESHSTIGATGVAWIWNPLTRSRIIQPQTGYTRIGRGAFLGTDVTVVRGSVNETTEIGEGALIAHGSKIGHGAQIGSECHFANNVSIAGNVALGKQCFLGSGVVIRPQIRIAERTVIGAGAVVVKDSSEPGVLLIGAPAKVKEGTSSQLAGVPKALENER